MDPYAKQRALARQITDPEQVEEIATRALAAIGEQYPDFEQVSFYFKRAFIETWPTFCDEDGFEQVMKRGQKLMEEHHEHLLYMIYGDHGYGEEVRELIEVLASNIYNSIRGNPEVKPTWNPKWLECAADLGVEPEELKSHQYISWIGRQVSKAQQEKDAKLLGKKPEDVGPYDLAIKHFGGRRRRR